MDTKEGYDFERDHMIRFQRIDERWIEAYAKRHAEKRVVRSLRSHHPPPSYQLPFSRVRASFAPRQKDDQKIIGRGSRDVAPQTVKDALEGWPDQKCKKGTEEIRAMAANGEKKISKIIGRGSRDVAPQTVQDPPEGWPDQKCKKGTEEIKAMAAKGEKKISKIEAARTMYCILGERSDSTASKGGMGPIERRKLMDAIEAGHYRQKM